MKQQEFDKIIEILKQAYHRSNRQYDLPYPGIASYNAMAKNQEYWSCPMTPSEIEDLIINEFYDKLEEEN